MACSGIDGSLKTVVVRAIVKFAICLSALYLVQEAAAQQAAVTEPVISAPLVSSQPETATLPPAPAPAKAAEPALSVTAPTPGTQAPNDPAARSDGLAVQAEATKPSAASPVQADPSVGLNQQAIGVAGAAKPPVVAPDVDRAMPASPAAPLVLVHPDTIAPAAESRAHDLSVLGMFMSADPIVKGVMVLLALASVATWAQLVFKFLELGLIKRRVSRSIEILRMSGSLAEAMGKLRKCETRRLVEAAITEGKISLGLPTDGIKERVQIVLIRMENALVRRRGSGTGILATVASTGPFVGLFGTVWGIMHSFIGIANSNTTNLAVVAPGIAEALLATGIGLVAAIPAVVIYNWLVRSIANYRALVGDAHALIMCHLSRDLDRAYRDLNRADSVVVKYDYPVFGAVAE